ncbi:MAG: hypothetical protein NTY46_05805 [Candidatus Sumerlaeota bacterium]|nr:hypothetical protein [Candidatus Sumerlaeota bacterium]
MGVLTDDMNRLRGKVESMRCERLVLNQALAHGAKNLCLSVSAMKAGIRKEQSAAARHARAERKAFTKNLEKTVGHMRKENKNDLAGAHKAWFGKAS